VERLSHQFGVLGMDYSMRGRADRCSSRSQPSANRLGSVGMADAKGETTNRFDKSDCASKLLSIFCEMFFKPSSRLFSIREIILQSRLDGLAGIKSPLMRFGVPAEYGFDDSA
jgi:hypothetical protein